MRTRVVLAFCVALPTLAAHAEPIDIGDRRQVFVNRRFLADSKDVELVVHPPVKSGEATVKPEKPWETGIGPYSSVLHDGGMYHMFYHVMSHAQWHEAKYSGAICYARSKDGITWEKPVLGIAEFNGNKDNNIILGHGAGGVRIGQDGGMVFIDPNAPPEQRFRMLIRATDVGEGLHLWSSPDGLHWKLTHKDLITARPQARGHHLDTQNVLFYDPAIKKYVCYVRVNVNEPDSQGRSVGRGESDHLGDFPVAQDMTVVLKPDAKDKRHGFSAVDYYTNCAIRYPWADNAYYLFPTMYYHYLNGVLKEFGQKVPTNAGPLHSGFMASADGITMERFDRRAFVDLGTDREYDCRAARMIWGLVPDTTGEKMYMYYLASDWLHGWDRNEENKEIIRKAGLQPPRNLTVISRLVLRRDGYVSVQGAYTGGEFTTPELTFSGKKLCLNVDTSALGFLQVEIQGADGKPLPGYAAADCDIIHTANNINREVTWKGKTDLPDLQGKPVRLRFVIQDADLYAFQFTN